MHKEGDFLFVHGSARNPLNEYVFPEDIYNPRKMEKIFQIVDKYCFQGHTHVPGIFTENLQFFSPADLGYTYKLDGKKTLINVGSVGQPRDGDRRACYVLLDKDVVTFRRVEYDVMKRATRFMASPISINTSVIGSSKGDSLSRPRLLFVARGQLPTPSAILSGICLPIRISVSLPVTALLSHRGGHDSNGCLSHRLSDPDRVVWPT